MSTQTLHFTIAGEFLTNIARQWFWEEGRPYSVCEDLLMNSLIHPDITEEKRKEYAQQIIEGRMKLIGDSHEGLELVEDGKNVRPLSMMVEQQARKLGIQKVKDMMEADPIPFIDPYSTTRSIRAFKEMCTHQPTRQEVFEFFCCHRDGWGSIDPDWVDDRYYDELTKMGMWLFDEPELVYDALGDGSCKVGSPEFWDNIYQAVMGYESEEFKARNAHYRASLRVEQADEQHERNLMQEAIDEGTKWLNNLKEKTDNEGVKYGCEVALGMIQSPHRDQIDYVMLPDDIINWQGLISPKGEWFSCSFAGHNQKAYFIIRTHPEWFNLEHLTKEEVYKLEIHNALDFLLKAGWCACRSRMPGSGFYLDGPPISSGKRATKAQSDKIWEAIVKHDVRPENMDIIGY